ncbi:MAG: class F sortase [Actinobacteria bacterium]|nr:class F sortase [Actinomycetota bacterium]
MRPRIQRRHPRRSLFRVLAGVVFAVVMLGVGSLACGEHGTFEEPSVVAIAPAEKAPPSAKGPVPMPESEPVSIEIPSLGVSSEVMDLGLRPDGSMEVPPGAYPAGWYTAAPTPGELGPAIIAGHVNWNGDPGVFFELHKMTPRNEITVRRRDGSTALFGVDNVAQYPKNEFPTEAVYGNIDHAGLRLITCGGDFDKSAHSYLDNIVVYASLIGSTPA